jgi:hypothetical protein
MNPSNQSQANQSWSIPAEVESDDKSLVCEQVSC